MKLTSVKSKPVGVPKTNQEKFDYLRKKNPEIIKLLELFDLEISL